MPRRTTLTNPRFTRTRIVNTSGAARNFSWVPPNGILLAAAGSVIVTGVLPDGLSDIDAEAMNSALQAGDVDVDYIPSGDAAIWDQTITLRESFSSQATGKLIFNASVPAKVRIINGHVQITESSLPGYTLHYAKARLTIDSAGATAVTDYVGLTGSVSDLERFQQVVNAQAVLATGSTLNIQCTGITGAGTTGVTGFVNLTLIPEP